MKFRTTPAFDADYAALPAEHRTMFRDRIAAFSNGCDTWFDVGPSPHPWPANLRVHRLVNTDIWAMTWHYRRPDGRATFEFLDLAGGTILRWRRIGGHGIYIEP
jgi:hypothetical protein